MSGKMQHIDVQSSFLEALRRERVPVALYLISGIKLHGEIESFDGSVLVLQSDSRRSRGPHRSGHGSSKHADVSVMRQMIFKHAISTIQPLRHVKMADENLRDAGCNSDASGDRLSERVATDIA